MRSTTASLEDALCELIAEAQASGELPAARGSRDLARFFLVTMQGLKVMGAIDPDRSSLMGAVEVALGALD